jgi:hypothetical protein
MADEVELDPELQAFIQERLGEPFEGEPDPEPDDSEPEGDDEGQEEEDGGEEHPPVDSPPSNIFEVAPGVAINREQALSYYQFDAILKGRPELVGRINDLINAPAGETVVTEPAPVSLDIPEEYRDDPAFKAIHDAYSAQNAHLTKMQQRLDELQSLTVDRDREETLSVIDTTRARFQQEHSLSNEEMDKVAQTAGHLEILPKLMTGIDPVTGQAGPRDRSQAITRAFEIAYWYLPEMREKALSAQVSARAKSTQRKQRLAGVSGGGGGSVPQNTDPRKMNALERREAMIREVAGFGGQEE